jgi:hypothetical protein
MKKQKNIIYTLQELNKLSETPLLFLQMIQLNKWHRLVYKNDDEFNEKVKFIRGWYKDKTGQIK